MITAETLASVRVLYRQNDTMSLWGIPNGMRPGQQPADLMQARPFPPYGTAGAPGRAYGPRPDWIWLGSPGWWGRLSAPEIALVEAFLALHKDDIPTHPNEWSSLD